MFDQMFQADRSAGDVVNMHGLETVLCPLDGICDPFIGSCCHPSGR